MSQEVNQYSNDPSFKAVALGLDTERFIADSKIGVYLVERAHQCRINALEQLATANPIDSDAIRELQWAAKVPDLFLLWLDEAISTGTAAEESIRVEDSYGR